MVVDKGNGIHLLVGLDESNHMEDIINRGEIVTATFSYNPKDGVERAYSGKRRDKELKSLKSWVDGTRDYRFAILANREVRSFQPNAPLVAPDLVCGYLNTLLDANKEPPDNLRLFVDGIITRDQRAYLKEIFSSMFKTTVIRNFVKRKKVSARRRKGRKILGPRVIQMADVLSNRLFHGYDYNGDILTPDKLINHKKRVIVDEDTLLKMIQ